MVSPVTLRHPAALPQLPQAQAVYLIWPKEGRPHLGRTNVLRRRLTRLFERWQLGTIVDRVEYWLTGSRLEQWQVSYRLARQYFPDDYEQELRLPKPSYVKLILSNEFPRTQITTRLTGGHSVFYGPFPTRASADQFEAGLLDLFQLRRCQEDLAPSPDHPGCIYGEMLKCLRPCQQVVTIDEYSSEAHRVTQFLNSHGQSMLEAAHSARDLASEQLRFEDAAREHARAERVAAVVHSGGDLARDVLHLHGVAITRAVEAESVLLWFLRDGLWADPILLSLALVDGKPLPLDSRLRETIQSIPPKDVAAAVRQQHLSLLAKWYYSSWRDGEWITIGKWPEVPYRRLVNAVHRVYRNA